MRKVLSLTFLLVALSVTAHAQCTVTSWATGAPVVQVVESQLIRITCPNLRQGLGDGDVTFRFIALFQPSGVTGRIFQVDRDSLGVSVPPGAAGSTSIILYKLGWGLWTIPLAPPVATSAPILVKALTIVLDRIETTTTIITDGVIPRVRIRYLITFQMENVGQGGTFLFHFIKASGEVVRVGQVFPRSNALADPQGQVDIYDDELIGVTGVFVTDPNDPSIPPSNTLPLSVVQ